jgi:hypothetical protein
MLKIVATVIWAGTAGFGLYLLGVWLSHGGLRQQATRVTVFPAALIFAHPVLATTGLLLWTTFLITHHGYKPKPAVPAQITVATIFSMISSAGPCTRGAGSACSAGRRCSAS